jgi:hypothetical protein
MNDLLGADVGVRLTQAGPASAGVAEALAENGSADSLLAGMFWLRFVRSEIFPSVVKNLGGSNQARPVVVSHAQETRFNLLLLDPLFDGDPAAQTIDPVFAISAMIIDEETLGTAERVAAKVPDTDTLSSDLLLTSGAELASNVEFGVVLAKQPEEIDNCAVSPALAITEGDEVCCTVGITVELDGSLVATTAEHALGADPDRLSQHGNRLEVLSRHRDSDSCLLELHEDPTTGRKQRGLGGPLRGMAPAPFQEVYFSGAKSGNSKTTTQVMFDPTILDVQVDQIARIYTDPGTVPGDSGAALIDQNDRILGFAHRRSSYGSKLQYSSWVWAEQVCMAHGLYGLGDRTGTLNASR